MLVNTLELLQVAQKEKRAIAAFNVYNMETVQAAFRAAEEERQPIILALGERYLPIVRMDAFSAMVKTLAAKTNLPVALHLDHAEHKSSIIEAIRCGFTSVMYDGSKYNLEENIIKTKEIAELAHLVGVSVEGEVGSLKRGSYSDEAEGEGVLTDPHDAQQFVERTGIDFLAAAIGTVHGMYQGEPHIDLARLSAIRESVSVPLVLHGGSGTPDAVIREAIQRGITKINVNTEISIAAVRSLQNSFETHSTAHLSTHTSKMQIAAELAMRKFIRLFANVS
ncbi:ketose-bisphosphate aldolase [Sporolactobacillus kofuensis]|uniref:Ketose-bisphosphate aldolase n=1 Tax=Sporolactobacillus kofuensis TaxID=269672 RepID=A0ABW1WE77_9BACL|nr:class II fructose-bisphosphate aldolase [Sporolactobacillus kofuensis]MCO7174889.1 class II fructose-bisphosphate aldolase [Sporolactobacillus kofuensis]